MLTTEHKQTMQPKTGQKQKGGTTKRKIPTLYSEKLSDEGIELHSAVPAYKEFVFRSLIEGIAEGVKLGQEEVRVVQVSGTQEYVYILREHWKEALLTAMDFFSSPDIEQFDKAIICRNLSEQL